MIDGKPKRRVDWYMDMDLFLQAQKLAYSYGINSVQKLFLYLLKVEIEKEKARNGDITMI